ncbi:hypothetical protein LTR85_003272 [Meristemomyces frigidus]|nr:hypothetical protein LTR85_003272 [Meristemomyces frigidus]
MDSWQTAQNWVLFAGVAGGLSYYYWSQNKPTQAAATANRRRSVQEPQPKAKRRTTPEDTKTGSKSAEKPTAKQAPKSNDGAKKRKGQGKQPAQAQATPAIAEEKEDDDEIDMSTKHFAEQLSKARKGNDLSTKKGTENRLRTVKQGSAVDARVQSSASSQADADDDMSPTASPEVNGGDVSDMLEPAAKGPSTLRLTASAKPQKEKVARQPKQEEIETKKQRQNRMKKEQQRLEREAEEKERKVAEEKQRRAARMARGEPAKNGIPVSKPPASNAWTEPKAGQSTSENTTPAVNGTSSGPLLDTFDAESTASSNDGMKASTAATSTTQRDKDGVSEEEQMSQAMKQSEDESGWTTVEVPKKQKKKQGADEDATRISTPIEPAPTPKAAPPASKPAVNGKPNGYSALKDEYEQRADVDPNDASNWDA